MKARTIQVVLVDIALTAIGLVALAVGTYHLFGGSPATAATALGSGLVLVLAGSLHRFESLKGLGVEVKLRKLDDTINKAQTALEQMRSLTELVGANLIKMSASIGRLGSAPSVSDAYDLSRQVKRSLQSVDSPPAAVRSALEPWARITAFDMLREKLDPLRKELAAEADRLSAEGRGQSGEEGIATLRRAHEIASYFNLTTKDMHRWALPEYVDRMGSILEEAPGLSETRRRQIRDEFRPVLAQLRYLVSELDYEDKSFWFALRTEK